MGSPLDIWLRQQELPVCQIVGLYGHVQRPPLPPEIKARLEEAHRKAVRERARDGR